MVTQIPEAAAAAAGLASAGHAAGEERVVLRDGSVTATRPLLAADAAAVAAWFEGLGEETRHARFLAGIKGSMTGHAPSLPRPATGTTRL